MEQYAMYLRKSRADVEAEQCGEGETLARHRHILEELAIKKNILPSQITVYQEIVSGESISNRPEVQRLLKDVYSRKYKGVLVVEVERLARGNTKDQGEIAEAFKYSGTQIITPTKTYNPDNEFDEEYFEFGLFMSRREYKTIRRRMEAGRLESVRSGNYLSAVAPYGYDLVVNKRNDRTLTPNDKSQYVKMIYDLRIGKRMAPGAIARLLTTMGVSSPSGHGEWTSSTIRWILSNEVYYGMIRWQNRKKTVDYDGANLKQSVRLNSNYQLYEGKHPAIISKEQFVLAQEMPEGIPVNVNHVVTNPFAGLLACKHCGKMMYYLKYNEGNCATRMVHPPSVNCKTKSMPYSDIMELVIKTLKNNIIDFEFKTNNPPSEDELRIQQLNVMESQLKKKEAKREMLFDAFEDGTYSKEEFVERKQILNSDIESLKQCIANMENSVQKPIDYNEKIIKFKEVIEALSDNKISAKVKNDLLKSIINVITYDCEDYGRNLGGLITLEIKLK